jgi:hypothetical protein
MNLFFIKFLEHFKAKIGRKNKKLKRNKNSILFFNLKSMS